MLSSYCEEKRRDMGPWAFQAVPGVALLFTPGAPKPLKTVAELSTWWLVAWAGRQLPRGTGAQQPVHML